MEPQPVQTLDELDALAPRDALLYWVAQGFAPAVRAWRLGDAIAVGCGELSTRDRLAISGPISDVAPLVQYALPILGPNFRPLGDVSLIRSLCERLPELSFVAEFDWMETSDRPPEIATPFAVCWLADADLPAVVALVDEAFSDSNAHPSRPGVRRWAGAECDGRLVAIAADAWSTRGLGFVAGVATAPEYRGRGAATAVTAFVTDALVREEGRAALMADSDNAAAIAAYSRLGFLPRRIAAARLTDRSHG